MEPDGYDPVVQAVETLWRRAQTQIRDRETVRLRLPSPSSDPEGGVSNGLVVLPVFDGAELLALVYVDRIASDEDAVSAGLKRLSGSLATTMLGAPEPRQEQVVEAYLERTPVREIHRQKLLLLLERNGWNIACVARLMGITRRTVYLRLRRYGIPREHRYKTRLRRGPRRGPGRRSIAETARRP